MSRRIAWFTAVAIALAAFLRGPSAALAQQSVKQRVVEAVEALPADATIEDAMERLYFLCISSRRSSRVWSRRTPVPR